MNGRVDGEWIEERERQKDRWMSGWMDGSYGWMNK